MKKKQTIPSAFDNVLTGMGFGNAEEQEGVTDMDHLDSIVDVEPTTKQEPVSTIEEPEVKKPGTAVEDTTEIPEEVLNQMNGTQPEQTQPSQGLGDEEHEVTHEDLAEAQQVGAFFDAVAEKFGWNADDINEDDRPVTIEEFTKYIQDVVVENSIPQYADERIEQLDAFVKNGGNFEDFYKIQQQYINYDNIDLEDESNQRAVISEYLRTSGYTDKQIANKIDRYETADLLEDEAIEALDRLKQIKAEQVATAAREQEAHRIQQEEQNKAFVQDLTTQIKNLNEIRGIAVPKEDRQALFDYIFRQDANGLSQYQKDFQKNLSRNLIESAYFTMRADSFVNQAKKSGQTTAAQKLRQMLRHTSKNHSSYNADEDKQRPAWEIASKLF